MKLSTQAVGCVMVALQQAILNQEDIVPVLQNFDFEASDEGDGLTELVVSNPPSFVNSPVGE